MNLGSTVPNFEAHTTQGDFRFYDYVGDNWAIVFSHPMDFTPVCTTEIKRMAELQSEFNRRKVKILVLSIDTVDDHLAWLNDVNHYGQVEVRFPLIGDERGDIARELGILDSDTIDFERLQTVRSVLFIGPDRKVKALISYPPSTGRNFDEILRVIDSLQLTATHKGIVTPADWKVGEDVLVKPGAAIEGAESVALPSGKNYLQYVSSRMCPCKK